MNELDKLSKEIQNTQVIILAGGKAKRMGNIDKPKALLQVNGTTLLDHTIDILTGCGFKDFRFLLGYRHEDIESHIGDGSKYGIKATYSVEPETVKGRAKAIKYALETGKIDKNKRALIYYPDDIFTDRQLPIKLLLQHLHIVEARNALVTILFTSGTHYPFGVGELDSDMRVTNFIEKPFIQQYTNTGQYIIEPEVLSRIEKDIDLNSAESPELEHGILPQLASENKVFGMVIPSQVWHSVNTFKEHEEAEKILSGKK
ncbi:MAG: nucleotidyltransferase family protein [Candidatus Aenigmarchaeota archaeon]|nr:nucleotidyltransferase family protein [Candidatus Aenigmarchaeota archaeon]